MADPRTRVAASDRRWFLRRKVRGVQPGVPQRQHLRIPIRHQAKERQVAARIENCRPRPSSTKAVPIVRPSLAAFIDPAKQRTKIHGLKDHVQSDLRHHRLRHEIQSTQPRAVGRRHLHDRRAGVAAGFHEFPRQIEITRSGQHFDPRFTLQGRLRVEKADAGTHQVGPIAHHRTHVVGLVYGGKQRPPQRRIVERGRLWC